MIKIQKYAAVDIGSNAVRLLICSVISQEKNIVEVKKISLVRVPIRLGLDGFLKNKIKTENRIRLNDAMSAFKLLMKIHNVSKYKICATSAMREATNTKDIISDIYSNTGLKIDVISGKDEASLIADTFFANHFNFNETYLFIDIGGGSTELSIIFNIGRRTLERRFKKATYNSVVEYIQRVKIEAAKKQLEIGRKTVNEVMYETGYTDVKAFRDVFKKLTAMTPIEYRNKYNKEWV